MDRAMYAYRCRQCGRLHYPASYVCQDCGGRDFTAEALGGSGTLLTWTRIYSLPAGFTEPSRGFGLVRLKNGLTVTGVLAAENAATGMELWAAVDVVRVQDGVPQYGLVFRPAT